mmetsp:Transcript_68151/g.168388  ORF Transcript_68151/g.168388 Transcript_68151/m.168388 type:complete len:120 (-) Transcript_68151:446-805(-)
MVYIDNLDNFIEAGQQLFISSPGKTRYLVKYRHVDAKLVLKITDDTVCLKYKTDQHKDLKRIEKLNNFFLRLSCEPEVTAESAAAVAAAIEEEDSMQISTPAPQSQQQQHSNKKGKKGK